MSISSQLIFNLFYYFFASVALTCSIMVVISINPIHSILFLILVFCNTAGLFILLGAEFLALLFLIVYVGAIAVLFLFVVMLLQTNVEQTKTKDLTGYAFIGIFFLIILGLEFFLSVFNTTFTYNQSETINKQNWTNFIINDTNLEIIGLLLYDEFFTSFILSGIILLIAMIGAIILTIKKKKSIKTQENYIQIARNYKATVNLWNKKKNK